MDELRAEMTSSTTTGYAIVSRRISDDGRKVGYMFRESPDDEKDSGWRFLAGDESVGQSAENSIRWTLMPLKKVASLDPSIVPYVDRDPPCAFQRESSYVEFREVPVGNTDDVPDTIEHAWSRIEAWLADNAPAIHESFRPGAARETVERTQDILGVVFPDDLVRSYLRHDGQNKGAPGFYYEERLLSLGEIVAIWKALKKRHDAGEFDNREAKTDWDDIRSVWWSPGWVPLLFGTSRSFTCIDLDPNRQGESGQMISWHPKNAERNWHGATFWSMLDEYVGELEAGVLEFGEKDGKPSLVSVAGDNEDEDDDDLEVDDDPDDDDIEDDDDLDDETRLEINQARGDAHVEDGEFREAIDFYTTALQINPRDIYSLAQRCACWVSLNEFTRALEDANIALRLDPDDAEYTYCWINRGFSHEKLGRFAEALADYERAMELDPKDVLPKNNAAWLLSVCPDPAVRNGRRAMQLSCRACIETDWEDGAYLATYATALAESGKFEEAIKAARKALKFASDEDAVQTQKILDTVTAGQPYRQT